MENSFKSLSTAALNFYRRKGVVCLRGVIQPEWLKCSREGVRKSASAPGRFFRDYSAEGSPARYTFEFWRWETIPEFKRLVLDSNLGEISGQLLEADHVNLLLDQWFRREAGSVNAAPWHHDEPYLDFFEGQKCVLWFPLEDTSSAEGLTFIGGSHAWGKLFMAQDFGKREPFGGHMGGYEPTTDFAELSADYLSWDMRIGDCLVFDFRTLHRATRYNEPVTRTSHRMLYAFGDQNVVFKPRGSWTDEISRYLIERGQRSGETINCELTPVVYSRRL
jgi:hypothetical protein